MSRLIRSENKTGTILSRKKNTLLVQIDSDCATRSSGCNGGCGSCGGESKLKKTTISCSDAQNYPIGDRIQLQHYILNENIVAFIVFGVPIASAFFTILGWYIYSPSSAESPQSYISAILAFAAGFIIIHIFDRWFRTKYPSRILSKISTNDNF